MNLMLVIRHLAVLAFAYFLAAICSATVSMTFAATAWGTIFPYVWIGGFFLGMNFLVAGVLWTLIAAVFAFLAMLWGGLVGCSAIAGWLDRKTGGPKRRRDKIMARYNRSHSRVTRF